MKQTPHKSSEHEASRRTVLKAIAAGAGGLAVAGCGDMIAADDAYRKYLYKPLPPQPGLTPPETKEQMANDADRARNTAVGFGRRIVQKLTHSQYHKDVQGLTGVTSWAVTDKQHTTSSFEYDPRSNAFTIQQRHASASKVTSAVAVFAVDTKQGIPKDVPAIFNNPSMLELTRMSYSDGSKSGGVQIFRTDINNPASAVGSVVVESVPFTVPAQERLGVALQEFDAVVEQLN